MTLTRRGMIAGLGATAGLALSRPVWSSTAIGGMQLDTLSDGTLHLPGSFIFGPMPQDEIAPIIEKYDLSAESLTPECNLTLLRHEDRVILFDVGAGPDFMPSAGKLMQAFDALDLTPEDVTHVVFTHGHPDHLWGLLDDFDDPLFTEAEYFMGRAERDYWLSEDTVDTIGTARQSFAVGAKRRLEAIADQIITFEDGDEVLPGVMAHASIGHTPGHMSFELRDGSEAALVLGDAIGNHHVAFEKPGLISGSDQDGETAAQTRLRLLDHITTDKMQVIGFHLPHGGRGHADRHGDGYIFVSENM